MGIHSRSNTNAIPDTRISVFPFVQIQRNSSSVSIAAIVALPDCSYSFDRIKEHTYELKLDEISNQCFTIIKKEHSDSVYLAEKEQYRLDRKAYDEHPNLYECEPSFDYEFDYWLELTEIGRQYIEWMES